MREQNAKKDKISMRRLLSNIKYILDFSFKENKKMALAQIVGRFYLAMCRYGG